MATHTTEDWYAKRDLPRLELNIAVWVYTVPAKDPVTGKQQDPKDLKILDSYNDDDLRRVHAMDISGGGMCLFFDSSQAEYIRKVIDQSALLGLTFFVPDPENPAQIHAVSEMRWFENLTDANRKGVRMGVRYIKIKPSDKDTIVNWIIKKLIEKGLEER